MFQLSNRPTWEQLVDKRRTKFISRIRRGDTTVLAHQLLHYHAIIYEWNRQFLYCVGLDGTIHMRFLSLVSKIVTVFVYLDPIIPNSDDMA